MRAASPGRSARSVPPSWDRRELEDDDDDDNDDGDGDDDDATKEPQGPHPLAGRPDARADVPDRPENAAHAALTRTSLPGLVYPD